VSDLLRKLVDGAVGVKWQPPATIAIVRDTPDEVVFEDPVGTRWAVAVSPAPFALLPGEDEALADDLAASARSSFDAYWWKRPRLDANAQPHTADLSWSPILEVASADSGNGRVLRVIRYLVDEPDLKTIAGELIIPTAAGHVEIRALAKTPVDPEPVVRAALDAAAARLEVLSPPARAHEVVLESARCAFVPPPRYVPMQTRMAPGLQGFHRAALDGWRRLFDVWRIGIGEQPALDPRPALAARAEQIVRDWETEGITDIELGHRFLDAFGNRPQIEQYVRFKHRGELRHTMHRWWIEPDGAVYRIGANAPPTISQLDLRADLMTVQETWRTLQ
jgi:hypothetical protein